MVKVSPALRGQLMDVCMTIDRNFEQWDTVVDLFHAEIMKFPVENHFEIVNKIRPKIKAFYAEIIDQQFKQAVRRELKGMRYGHNH